MTNVHGEISKINDNSFKYKNGKLIVADYSKLTYRHGKLATIRMEGTDDRKAKVYFNKKGQIDHFVNFSAIIRDVAYTYDRHGYLTKVKGQMNYKNHYRNGLLVRQDYRYKDYLNNKYIYRKGKIIYQYKKVRVAPSVYKRVKAQQKSLYYVGNLDYYAVGFTNWFFYLA